MNKQNIRLNNYCACERKKNSHENCLFSTTKQLECESIWYNSHLIPTKNMTIIVRLSLGSYGTSLKQHYQHGRQWNISNVKQNISSKNKAKSKTSNLIKDILVCFFFGNSPKLYSVNMIPITSRNRSLSAFKLL